MKYLGARFIITLNLEVPLRLWKKWVKRIPNETELKKLLAETALESFAARFDEMERIEREQEAAGVS